MKPYGTECPKSGAKYEIKLDNNEHGQLEIGEMEYAELKKVPAFTYSRDPELHFARRFQDFHEMTADQHVISIARFPEHDIYVLDGLTRLYAWTREGYPEPEKVIIHVYDVESVVDAYHLYRRLHDRKISSTRGNRVVAETRGLGKRPASSYFHTGQCVGFLKVLSGNKFSVPYDGDDLEKLVCKWIREIDFLDHFDDFKKTRYPQYAMAANALLARHYGFKHQGLHDFLHRVSRCEGVSDGVKKDGVEALYDYLNEVYPAIKLAVTKEQDRARIMVNAVFEAFELTLEGKMLPVEKHLNEGYHCNLGAADHANLDPKKRRAYDADWEKSNLDARNKWANKK